MAPANVRSVSDDAGPVETLDTTPIGRRPFVVLEGGAMGARDRDKALARERARRAAAAPDAPPASTPRAAARACAWCGARLLVRPVGRIPKWCSQSCRQRAWEQRRAATSGRSAVEVVERVVQVPVETVRTPGSADWPALLHELVAQLSAGRIYARDLPALQQALNDVITGYTAAATRR